MTFRLYILINVIGFQRSLHCQYQLQQIINNNNQLTVIIITNLNRSLQMFRFTFPKVMTSLTVCLSSCHVSSKLTRFGLSDIFLIETVIARNVQACSLYKCK